MTTTSNSPSNLRRRAGVPVLLLLIGAVACFSSTDPLPDNATQFSPPAVYARWWAMTEACSGHAEDLEAIRWYRVPGAAIRHNGALVGGYWDPRGNRIVLPEQQVENADAVRHEMLHALIRKPGHPRDAFLEACASVVDCSPSCATDAGQWTMPPSIHEVFPSDSLEIDSRAELLPREADGQRWLELWVIVRNPRATPVMVFDPGPSTIPRTFASDVRGPDGGIGEFEAAGDSSRLYFHPYETKSRQFEFLVAPDLSAHHVTVGRYLLSGGFANHWAPYDTLIVSQ